MMAKDMNKMTRVQRLHYADVWSCDDSGHRKGIQVLRLGVQVFDYGDGCASPGISTHDVGRLQHPDIEAAELTRMLNAEYVEPMRQRDAEGRVTGLTGQTLPMTARAKGANLHPSADMLPDAVAEIKRLREMLLDLGVDPDG